MTSTLIECLAVRESRAVERAEAAAAKLRSGDTPAEGVQVALEAALGDLAHYRGLTEQLADYARAGGVYRPGAGASFLRDVAYRSSDPTARQRLDASRRATEALAALERRAVATSAFAGLTVPQYLTDLAAPAVHSSAPLTAMLAKPITDSGMTLTVSTWVTPAAGEAQATENATLTQTAIAQGSATVGVKVYDTASSLSLQVIDRSDAVDLAVVPDQIATLAAKVETDLIGGAGTSGTLLGFTNAASTTAQSYVDASPTGAEVLAEIEKGYRTSIGVRGFPSAPMVCTMHPRRWSWLRQKLATEGLTAGITASSYPSAVARIGDIEIVASPAIPTTAGAGTEDVILVFPADTIAVLTSAPSISVNLQTSALGAMTALITGYQYAAAHVGRGLPGAVVVVSGSGLVAP